MSEWKNYNLAEMLISANTGLDAIKRAPIVPLDTGIRCLRIQDVSQSKLFKEWGFTEVLPHNYLKFQLKRGDIIVARTGATVGVNSYIADDLKSVFNNGLIRLRANNDFDSKYIYYLLNTGSFKSHIYGIAFSTSSQPNIQIGDLLKFQVKAPDLSEQIKISKMLTKIDSKITINQQINQTLEEMAQAVFKSWFVDFEPVRAKVAVLESGGSAENATIAAMQSISGKSPDELIALKSTDAASYHQLETTANLFPSCLTDSDLGEIPEGWEVSEIGNEVTVVGGGTPSTKNPEFWDGGEIHWTTPKDMSNLTDKIMIDTDRKITDKGLSKISSGLLPVDTVLMSSRAPVGYLAIAKIPIAINQGYIAMKCEQTLSAEFVVQWCASNMADIKQRASGTTFAEISKKSFKPIPAIVPTLEIVEQYNVQAKSIYLQIENNIREIASLTQIRDSLLPKLLSGEIDVSAINDSEAA